MPYEINNYEKGIQILGGIVETMWKTDNILLS